MKNGKKAQNLRTQKTGVLLHLFTMNNHTQVINQFMVILLHSLTFKFVY